MSGRTTTRADLADAVYRLEIVAKEAAAGERLPREACANLVEDVLQCVMDALAEEGVVKISSFGSFEVREKAARMGRNPKTGEGAVITPRRVPSFRASQVLKARLNDTPRR